METFSANSLKCLDCDLQTFKKRYIEELFFSKEEEGAKKGKKFHSLIQYYLKDFDIRKLEASLDNDEAAIWQNIVNSNIIKKAKDAEFKNIEQPFYVKFNKTSYLTGRYDAVIKEGGLYKILDWKMKNIPSAPDTDIQTIVYLLSASKLYKSNNVSITYYSLTENKHIEVNFKNAEMYEKFIQNILNKLIF